MAQSTVAEPSLYQTEAPIQAPTSTTTTHQSPAISPRGTSSSALTTVDIPSPLNPVLEIPPPGPAVAPVNALSTPHLDASIPHGNTLVTKEDENDIWREMVETFEDLYQGLAAESTPTSLPAETSSIIAHTPLNDDTANSENSSQSKILAHRHLLIVKLPNF